MLLALDVSNTQTKIGLYRGAELLHHWRIATDREKTADEYAVLLRALFGAEGVTFSDVDAMAVSLVVPPLIDTIDRFAKTYLHTTPLMVSPGIRTGMRILYENPKEVGADRICDAVAAYARYGGPAIVVAFSTATTFSVVTAEGEFLGGAIAPGVGISMDALAEQTAQLHRVELVKPKTAIGRSTVAAMQAGFLYGFVGQVEEIVRRIRQELGGRAVAIATGGWAEHIIGECRCFDHHDPLLTLEGLRLIYDRNRQPVQESR